MYCCRFAPTNTVNNSFFSHGVVHKTPLHYKKSRVTPLSAVIKHCRAARTRLIGTNHSSLVRESMGLSHLINIACSENHPLSLSLIPLDRVSSGSRHRNAAEGNEMRFQTFLSALVSHISFELLLIPLKIQPSQNHHDFALPRAPECDWSIVI